MDAFQPAHQLFYFKQLLMSLQILTRDYDPKSHLRSAQTLRKDLLRSAVASVTRKDGADKRGDQIVQTALAKQQQSREVADKLLRCIGLVVATQRAHKTQEKLQFFVLQWLAPKIATLSKESRTFNSVGVGVRRSKVARSSQHRPTPSTATRRRGVPPPATRAQVLNMPPKIMLGPDLTAAELQGLVAEEIVAGKKAQYKGVFRTYPEQPSADLLPGVELQTPLPTPPGDPLGLSDQLISGQDVLDVCAAMMQIESGVPLDWLDRQGGPLYYQASRSLRKAGLSKKTRPALSPDKNGDLRVVNLRHPPAAPSAGADPRLAIHFPTHANLPTSARPLWAPLVCLDLSGRKNLSSSDWEALLFDGGFSVPTTLRQLKVADMNIGLPPVWCRRGFKEWFCSHVCVVPEVDLSCNFLGPAFCETLGAALSARTCKVTALDLSENASGFGWDRPDGSQPLNSFLELLGLNRTLTCFRARHCNLDYRAAFLLERALVQSKGPPLESLDLSGNPLGVGGVQCLLRVAAMPRCSVKQCCLQGVREGVASHLPRLQCNPLDPTGEYVDVDLRDPFHRAIMGTLLDMCDPSNVQRHFGGGDLGPAVVGSKVVRSSAMSDKNPCRPLSFTFDGRGTTYAVHKLEPSCVSGTRIKLSLRRFVVIAQTFQGLESVASQVLVAEAAGRCLVLRLCQVSVLLSLLGHPSGMLPVLRGLFPAMQATDKMRFLDSIPSPALQLQIRRATNNYLIFNPFSPNAAYELDLINPADRGVAEQLWVLDRCEREIQQQQQPRKGKGNNLKGGRTVPRPDTSQHGDWSRLRNVTINGDRVRATAGGSLPFDGLLKVDYSTAVYRAHSSLPPTPPDAVSFIAYKIAANAKHVTTLDRLFALRSVTHRLVLTVESLQALMEAFDFHEPLRSLHCAGAVSARQEVLVLLWPRLHGPSERSRAWAELLWGGGLLLAAEIPQLVSRLGRLDALDVQAIGRGESLASDLGSVKRTMSGMQASDCRFVCDLAIFEDRQVAWLLLLLASKEGSSSLSDLSWSEAGVGAFTVPTSWLGQAGPPAKGVFKATYSSTQENCRYSADVRATLAKRFCASEWEASLVDSIR